MKSKVVAVGLHSDLQHVTHFLQKLDTRELGAIAIILYALRTAKPSTQLKVELSCVRRCEQGCTLPLTQSKDAFKKKGKSC